jgi:hypothetical protein
MLYCKVSDAFWRRDEKKNLTKSVNPSVCVKTCCNGEIETEITQFMVIATTNYRALTRYIGSRSRTSEESSLLFQYIVSIM